MRFISSRLRSRAETRAWTASARLLCVSCLLLFAACDSSSASHDGGDDEDAETRSDSGQPTGADDDGGEQATPGNDGGGSGTSSDGGTRRDAGGSTSDAASASDSGGARDAMVGGGDGGGAGSCMAASLLSALKRSHMIMGASMEDETASAAAFDARYLYLSGGLFDGTDACTSCASGCNAGGRSCKGGACGWWGCWQYDQDPPGAYVRDFVMKSKAQNQIPMITYYELLQASGLAEGKAQVAAANDAAFMRRYLADFAFVLKQIGSEVALIHIEPDFWGYVQQTNSDPAAIPAKIASASSECVGFANNLSGMGRCMIAMVRKYAPNARVGLHGSGWGTNYDALANTNPNFDVAAEARKLGNFLLAEGAGDSDFVVVDASDRDAAWYDTQGQDSWWDETNKTLPNFKQAFAWAKVLAETVGKPILWWQVPVGNMQLPNTNQRWKDNRLDYFFDHPNEVAAAHGAGALFGAGNDEQTTPETDGKHLIARMKTYAGAPQKACP
jgi:hypothetical protein